VIERGKAEFSSLRTASSAPLSVSIEPGQHDNNRHDSEDEQRANPIRIHCSGVGLFPPILEDPLPSGGAHDHDHATPLKIASTVMPHSASNHSGM
jgi:hypothetical protein